MMTVESEQRELRVGYQMLNHCVETLNRTAASLSGRICLVLPDTGSFEVENAVCQLEDQHKIWHQVLATRLEQVASYLNVGASTLARVDRRLAHSTR